MILVWSRKQSQRVRAHGVAVGRRTSQWTTDSSRNSGTYIVYNSHVTCSNSSFSLTMVMPTSHFFCFSLVMLSASHRLLAQARFCGRTHLPLAPNSTTPTVQVIFRYLRPDAPIFNIHHIHSTCGHGDISAITLLILSLCGYNPVNILWYTAPVDMITLVLSISQQHPPYSHPQVMLIYYTRRSSAWSSLLNHQDIFFFEKSRCISISQTCLSNSGSWWKTCYHIFKHFVNKTRFPKAYRDHSIGISSSCIHFRLHIHSFFTLLNLVISIFSCYFSFTLFKQ